MLCTALPFRAACSRLAVWFSKVGMWANLGDHTNPIAMNEPGGRTGSPIGPVAGRQQDSQPVCWVARSFLCGLSHIQAEPGKKPTSVGMNFPRALVLPRLAVFVTAKAPQIPRY